MENYAKQNVSNLIGKFRNKIIRGQRCWKSYSKITRGRLHVLQILWDNEEKRLHDGEQLRKEKEKNQQIAFEAELISDKASNGQKGYDIAAKVLAATKRRLRQNNTKSEHGTNDSTSKTTAMQLLHQRTQNVLERTKFHRNVTSNVPDHLCATKSIRLTLLNNLLRAKRLKFQETLEKITHRLIAKRQTTVQLNIEDIRRFLHSGTEMETIGHVDIKDEGEVQYTGFLMLRSLEEGEIRQLVAKGIQLSTGYIVPKELSQSQSERSTRSPTMKRRKSSMKKFGGGGGWGKLLKKV